MKSCCIAAWSSPRAANSSRPYCFAASRTEVQSEAGGGAAAAGAAGVGVAAAAGVSGGVAAAAGAAGGACPAGPPASGKGTLLKAASSAMMYQLQDQD